MESWSVDFESQETKVFIYNINQTGCQKADVINKYPKNQCFHSLYCLRPSGDIHFAPIHFAKLTIGKLCSFHQEATIHAF